MPFREEHLDAYDHLFYGSHLPVIDAVIGTAGFDPIRDGHRAAAGGELGKLRGIWRAQEAFFANRIQSTAALTSGQPEQLRQAALTSAQRAQEWQGLAFDAESLAAGLGGLGARLVDGSGR